MRKNRKITKKMSVVTTNSLRFGAILVLTCVMVVMNLLASSSCSQLVKRKGELKVQLAKFEDSCQRASMRWEEMCIPERIDSALQNRGLAMRLPRPEQIVRMNGKGLPVPGQISLRHAKQTIYGSPQPAQNKYRRR